MPSVSKRVSSARSPTRDDQWPDFPHHAPATGPILRVRPLARHEQPMPARNRVGGDDRNYLAQQPTTHLGARARRADAVRHRSAASAGHATDPKESVFFDQIGQRLLLPMIQMSAASRTRKENRSHGCRLPHRPRLSLRKPIDRFMGHYALRRRACSRPTEGDHRHRPRRAAGLPTTGIRAPARLEATARVKRIARSPE